MDKDVSEIFSDSGETLDSDAIVYDMMRDDGMEFVGSQTDTVAGRVSTLSEVFLEWYLFDSSEKKDVKTFLATEKLQDVFTESDFMDLMCGGAYLDDDLLQYVSLKLPFYISMNKLHRMNASVSASNQTYLIKGCRNIGNKIKEIVAHKQEQQRVHAKEYYEKNKDRIKNANHEYYLQNREHILARNKQWVEEHPLLYKVYQTQWRHENAPALKKYHKKYRAEHVAVVSERKKKCYNAKKTQYQQRNRENYQKNKEKYLARNKEYREELKQKGEIAQKICAAYVFLLILRRKNKEKYLELYTQQQNPLCEMLKTCVALQNMDMNMCPFCNHNSEIVAAQCCNQKVLSIPNAMNEVQKLADALKSGKRPLVGIKTKQQNAQTKRLARSTYYKLHKSSVDAQSKQWIADHPERRQETMTAWFIENAAHVKQYQQQYRVNNAATISERKKKCYNAKKTQYQQRNRENYQKNKEKYLAAQKVRANEIKQKAASAKKICAAYVFLMNLRKEHREEYLKLYTKQQQPLLGMLKTCAALQSMDINMCPVCNADCGHKIEEFCNLKTLILPGAIEEIRSIAVKLKQK